MMSEYENLRKELNMLHERNELAKIVDIDYFEPGKMEYLEQYDSRINDSTGEIMMRFPARDTRYEGRTERIESVRVGDTVQVVRDNNSNIFELFTSKRKSLGNMPVELCNTIAPLYDKGELKINRAKVCFVDPISHRNRHAKHAVLFVELLCKLTNVENVQTNYYTDGEMSSTDDIDKEDDATKRVSINKYQDPDFKDINRKEDQNLVIDLNDSTLYDTVEMFEYKGGKKKKATPVYINGHKAYPRDRQVAINALAHAQFKCEIDESHPTFIRRKSQKTYTEPHHLVPMSYSDCFDVSLDREENIVSLCSNCHNQIHYGREVRTLIESLYAARKELLLSVGISITLDELLEMYDIH